MSSTTIVSSRPSGEGEPAAEIEAALLVELLVELLAELLADGGSIPPPFSI